MKNRLIEASQAAGVIFAFCILFIVLYLLVRIAKENFVKWQEARKQEKLNEGFKLYLDRSLELSKTAQQQAAVYDWKKANPEDFE